MLVTRVAHSRNLTASKYKQLEELAGRLGVLRSEVWNEYGSLKGVGIRDREIRNKWILAGKKFDVSARLWKETLRDVITNIGSYRAATKMKVRKAIFHKTKNESERKELYKLLRCDEWTETPFLRRQMRKHFKHGHTTARRTDHEIGLWTPHKEVRSILQKRTELRLGLLNQDSSCSPQECQRRAKCL